MSNNVFQNIQLQRIADGIQGGGSSVTVNIDVTGAGDMQGATSSAAGAHGLVPAPAAGDENKVLSGAGVWVDAGGGELGDLEDVDITSPTSGESLKYDGSKWVNGNVTAELGDLEDVTITSPTSGESLKYDGAKWVNGNVTTELGDLEDVTITSPTSGESLKYDGSKWVNGNVTEDLPDFIEEADGNLVTVEAAERPAKSLVVAINPVQSGSGDPSPDNIRPINGWTGANVTRTGKNLLGINEAYGAVDGITITNGIASGPNGVFTRSYIYIPKHLVGTSLTLSVKIAVRSNVSRAYTEAYINGRSISGNDVYGGTTGISTVSFTPTSTSDFFRITYGSGAGLLAVSDFQLELGSTATTYEPYIGQTYTISFPSEAGTVYGGTLDMTNGTLTVTKANIASYDGETLPGAWISDRDVYAEGTTPTTGAQVVYDLDTPITYQLTPTEVQMLLGMNNLWADTGEVKELKYINQTYNDLLQEVLLILKEEKNGKI